MLRKVHLVRNTHSKCRPKDYYNQKDMYNGNVKICTVSTVRNMTQGERLLRHRLRASMLSMNKTITCPAKARIYNASERIRRCSNIVACHLVSK